MSKRLGVVLAVVVVIAAAVFWLRGSPDASSARPVEVPPPAAVVAERAALGRAPADPVPNTEPAASAPRAPGDDEPEVTGRVLDSAGQGVPGVKVLIFLGPGGVPEATSGADGSFRVHGVAKGKHEWQAEGDDWSPASGQVVSPGQLLIRVERGAVLRGDLVDEENHPVATEIRVVSKDLPQQQKFTTSDAQGSFEVRGLKPAAFVVMARVEGDPIATETVKVPATGEVAVHLRVEKGAAVSGLLVDQSGRAVPRAAIHAQLEGDNHDDHLARTDGDGGFTLRHLKPGGLYRLSPFSAGERSTQQLLSPVKAPASGVKLEIVMRTTVKGRLVDARGTPITSFSLNFERQRAADGHFEFVVDEERDKVVVSATGFATQYRPVDQNAGLIDWGDVVMSDGRAVTVTAVDPAGNPIANAKAADMRTDHGENAMMDRTRVFPSNVATTDASGRARLEHLGEAETPIWVTHPQYATVMTKVAPGQSALQVTMTAASSISGSVHERDGSTLTFGQMTAQQPGQSKRLAMVQQNGKYRFDALPPGEWTVQAFADGSRFSRPMTLTVAAGAQLEQDFSMMSGVRLTMTLQPPVDFDFSAAVYLAEGDQSALHTAADVSRARAGATMLNSGGDGAWTTTQAQPGVATVLVLRRNDEVIQVTTGVFTVPGRDGAVEVRLSEPREIPIAK